MVDKEDVDNIDKKSPEFIGTGKSIPPIPVVCNKCKLQIEPGSPTHLCNCGAVFHEKCISDLLECPDCRRSIDRPVPPVIYKKREENNSTNKEKSSEVEKTEEVAKGDRSQRSEANAPTELSREIIEIRNLINEYFKVYDTRFNLQVAIFYVNFDENTLEENFDRVWRKLSEKGYIVSIQKYEGEHVLVVERKPKQKFRSVNVNLILLIATIFTTVLTGSMQYVSYENQADVMAMFSPYYLFMGGVFFALPLMVILACHEMGHYLTAKKYGLAVSLPFFISVPPPSPLGTAGAFISMRDHIPSRKALFDIGLAGPIVGLIVAIPVTIIGFILTNVIASPVPEDSEGLIALGEPLLFTLIAYLFPAKENVLIHPTAFAGWVGFLVTSLNLLPMGQLDGGHVARALFGVKARYVAYATVFIMITMSFLLFNFSYILLLLFVIFLGLVHPPPLNDISKLDKKRKMFGVFAFLLLIVCFVPAPMTPIPFEEKHSIEIDAPVNITAMPGENATVLLTLNNTGNVKDTYKIYPSALSNGWRLAFWKDSDDAKKSIFEGGKDVSIYQANSYNVTLKKKKIENHTMAVSLPESAKIGKVENITILFIPEKAQKKVFYHNITITVGYVEIEGERSINSSEDWNVYNATMYNLQNEKLKIGVFLQRPMAWNAFFDLENMSNANGNEDNLSIILDGKNFTQIIIKFKQPTDALANQIGDFRIIAKPYDSESSLLPNESRASIFTFEARVLPRHNISLESQNSEIVILPPGNASFVFILKNNGNDIENVNITMNFINNSGEIMDIPVGWITVLSVSNVAIAPGNVVGIVLQIYLPSEAESGVYYVRIEGRSPSEAYDLEIVTLNVQ
ncbi:MAG: site-2 protease family protein [Thermoplasmata archaeon]